jgi:hypothetical protein
LLGMCCQTSQPNVLKLAQFGRSPEAIVQGVVSLLG